ncbi:MAG: winged helix-turn-helix domain-containing protein [Methylacidiphilales bacterium]|nr:winged helix-turn-helix domain-containing protein [Candidatus Methylacidiphilales bacterium]
MQHKIMVVDDEADVIDMLVINLRSAGFQVIAVEDGAMALIKARNEAPSLIILDLMLPKMPGLEICKVLKSDVATKHIPIIMLTAKAEEVDKIVGLELGADDYVTKPFSPRELILRVNRSLRRGKDKVAGVEKMIIGDLLLDHTRHEVLVKGKPVDLTATEFRLLALLMERRGRVQGRDSLLNDVWGYESVIDTRTVDTHVRRLREKLGPLAAYIETIRGVGYRINEGDPAETPVLAVR